jgi:hypothetical protein
VELIGVWWQSIAYRASDAAGTLIISYLIRLLPMFIRRSRGKSQFTAIISDLSSFML